MDQQLATSLIGPMNDVGLALTTAGGDLAGLRSDIGRTASGCVKNLRGARRAILNNLEVWVRPRLAMSAPILRANGAGYSVAVPHMSTPHLDSELKKGSAEFLILSLVEDRALHGYDIARLIDVRSKGALTFYAASLYPLLYRLERRGWITGRWLEQAGARRRRMYRITAAGRRVLAAHRTTWDAFVRAVNLVTGPDHA